MRCILFLFLLLMAVAMPAHAGPSLTDTLRAGGLVIFLRHTETGPPHPDSAAVVPGDCGTQRLLNEEGRAQAVAIGEAFRSLGVPTSRVLASPFCRTIETAVLAFGTATPEAALALPRHLDAASHAAMGAALLRLIESAPPAAGENLILVGHSYHLMNAGGPRPEPQGAAAVLRRDGRGGFVTLALLAPQDWAWLVSHRTGEVNG